MALSVDRAFFRLRSHASGVFLAVALAVVIWSLGLSLAPVKAQFFKSHEWLFQPFYLTAHILTLQYFALVYRLNFTAGIAHLAIDRDTPATELSRALGPGSLIAAIAIAIPFCVLDYLYLNSGRYTPLGTGGKVGAVDHVMWALWSAEWVINALIWVLLIGFLIKNCSVIVRYNFRSPIEVVLHERHYRPFLRMSAQGASILLAFSAITVLYIAYTGGELPDYIGLAITTGLLLVSFLPPWLLLRSKVDRAVEQETQALRRGLAHTYQTSSFAGIEPLQEGQSPAAVGDLERRLEQAISLLRIAFLEQRHNRLGRTEARAVGFRLLAPVATIAWQFRQSTADIWTSFSQMAKMISRLWRSRTDFISARASPGCAAACDGAC